MLKRRWYEQYLGIHNFVRNDICILGLGCLFNGGYMNRSHTPEDVEKIQSGWRKRQVNEVYEKIRNDTIEEVAKEFDKMKPFGDTAQSFATYVRMMKR